MGVCQESGSWKGHCGEARLQLQGESGDATSVTAPAVPVGTSSPFPVPFLLAVETLWYCDTGTPLS